MLLLSAWLGLEARAQSEKAPAETVFSKPPAARTYSLTVPLIVGDQSRSDIRVILSTNREDLKLQAAPLLQELSPLLRPERLKQLEATADAQGNLRLPALKAAGLDAVFDEQKLELRVAVPAELRPASDIQIFGGLPPGAASALKPSDFSAYLNLLTGMDYVEQSANGQNEGMQPFHTDLEGAVNLHNAVVEGSASYTENAATPWQRNDVRLVYDDPPWMLRYSLGDLSYPTAGFQSYQSLLGLTVARNFSLQPYRITQPLGQTSFFLKGPSKVEVLVNGQPVQTLQLPAGPQNLRDFQFANGANDVNLRITDDVGRIETLQLSYFFDYSLLAQGEQEFAYSLGLPSRLAEGGPEYEARFPGFSAFHRLGLTDRLTTGLNLQGDGDEQMLGGNAVWATRYGTLQPDAAVSQVADAGWDYAARLGYRYADPAVMGGSSFSLAAQYTGEHFASLGNLAPSNSLAWNFSANYSHPLPGQMSVGVGGTYQLSRDGQRDLSGVNLLLSKRFGRRTSLSLTLARNDLSTGQTELRAFLSLTFFFPEYGQTVRLTEDTYTETSRADWQYTSMDAGGGWDANLGAQRQRDDYSGVGGLRYTGYRAEMSLSHDVTTPVSSADNVDNRTSGRFGTALVYADGQFAMSRPVQDSFAIVVPHPELAGQKIGVDPVRDSYTAEADWLGPAVLPTLTSYQVRKVTIDAPDLPLGYELGPGEYTVWPTYKSATVIRVGTGATVLLRGVLEAADGAPVSLQAGEIASLSEPKMKPIEIFTNRKGKFMAEGLKPGAFELRLFADAQATVRFEIPKGKAGLYDIGSLKLPGAARLENNSNNNPGK
jgi:outer membrane usher protein